ncbi:hypothetical protein [Hyalangium rubrum]|uniref:DGQHR domain-containing protein n=1 Tax=Hyalangium rubrum TaxID=3103134 RepID=A0ABU5HI13_9BACT|nr:hypothetical protein [Hyalangium sp. s54d21]MDY7232991.1 hypothetical protein [Hyalangium sp. s54d21]
MNGKPMQRKKRTRVFANTVLEGVTAVDRPCGKVYNATVSIAQIAKGLKTSKLLYSPKYQRGFRRTAGDISEENYSVLYPITSTELNIDPKRAQAIAVKRLMGKLYTVNRTWNARAEEDGEAVTYDEPAGILTIQSVLTIPDSGHRHLGDFYLAEWKNNPDMVPNEVVVDGTPVAKAEILELLGKYEPEEDLVFVDIYNLSGVEEGKLYDEFNSDAKKPSNAVGIDLNPEKNPSRRFVYRMMEKSKIFAREEIECRSTTIGSLSRKLTTNATLEGAVRSETEWLARLEADETRHEDLIDFTCAFFEAWSDYFPEFKPGATAEDRNKLRKTSFALSNILFHPLLKLVFRLWSDPHLAGFRTWEKNNKWRSVVAKIAGKHPNVSGKVMDRTNPDWRGKILIETLDANRKIVWSLSSTRQTRESAYQYLCTIAGIPASPPPAHKRAQKSKAKRASAA